MKAGTLALAAALFVAAVPRPAFAQVPAGAVVAEQRKIFEEANRLYDAGRFAEAEAKYLAAWSLNRTYDVAGNLAMVELKLGKARAAAEHFAYALREFPTGGNQPLRQRLTERFAEAKRQVATLRVRVNAPGATVEIDGRAIGQAPLADDVFVEPGAHVVRASLLGYTAGERSANGAAGAELDVDLALAPVKTKGPNLVVVISGALLTAAALGTGIGLQVAAGSKQTTAEDATAKLKETRGPSPCTGAFTHDSACAGIQSGLEQSGHLATASIVPFVGAGAIGAATVVYVLLARSKPAAEPTALRVMPLVGADANGISITGRF